MSIGLCDFFKNILKMCNGCALGCVLGFVVQCVLGGVLNWLYYCMNFAVDLLDSDKIIK